MDPVSIAEAVKILYGASETIYQFIKDTRSIDTSIRNLQRQVNGLAKVLDALSEALQHNVAKDHEGEKRQLWRCVTQSLEACYSTILELDQKLEGIRGTSKRHNVITQAIKTYKLGLDREEIECLLSEMQTHSINLQLALSTVQLMIAVSVPETVAYKLSSHFARLEGMMMIIDERLATSSYPQITVAASQNKVMAVTLNDNTKNLRQSAGSVMSSAATATGQTISSMTQGTITQPLQSVFEHFDPPDADPPEILAESTTGSELGKPIDPGRRTQIQSWIAASSANLNDIAELPESGRSTANPSDPLASIFSRTSLTSDTDNGEKVLEIFDESSDDDGLELQFVKSYIANAERKMEVGDFLGAEELFRRSLDGSQYLSLKRKQAMNLGDTQLQYARCCFHCNKVEDSEEAYLALTREPVKDVSEATRALHALHGLATVNLKRRNYEAAATHCRQALHGRRRTKTIGKHHADYFASLQLLAVISWARNDKIQAEACSDQLPKELKLDSESFIRLLEAEYNIASNNTRGGVGGSEVLSPEIQHGVGPKGTFSSNRHIPDGESLTKSQLGAPEPVSADCKVTRPSLRTLAHSDAGDTWNTAKISHTSPRSKSVASAPLSQPQPSPSPPSQEHSLLNDGNATHSANTGKVFSLSQSRPPADIIGSTETTGLEHLPTSSTPLMKAVKSNNTGLARNLLSGFGQASKAEVNVEDVYKYTPLHYAVINRNLDMCQLLVSHEAFVDAQDALGTTVLMRASSSGDFDICSLLLRNGADPNLTDAKGVTTLMYATSGSNRAICKLLLDLGATPDAKTGDQRRALPMKADPADLDIIPERFAGNDVDVANNKARIKLKPDSDSEATATAPNFKERDLPPVSDHELLEAKKTLRTQGFLIDSDRLEVPRALFWAIDRSNLHIVELLVKQYRVDLKGGYEFPPAHSQTALHKAARKGQHDICRRLLDGSEPNKADSKGETVLDIAIERKDLELCDIMLQAGADTNAVGPDGITYLIKATRLRNLPLIRLILSRGCDINKIDAQGMAALHWAAKLNYSLICKELIDQGADPNLKFYRGVTPLAHATPSGGRLVFEKGCSEFTALEVQSVLLSNGADPNLATNDGKTPLMDASESGWLLGVRNLLSMGAKISMKEKYGMIALHYAALNGHRDVCEELISHGASVLATECEGKTPIDFVPTFSRSLKKFLKSKRLEAERATASQQSKQERT